jgi:Periplasmic binding protein
VRTRGNDSVTGTRMRVVALLAAIAAMVGVPATPAVGQAGKEPPKATEVGVTPSEIHIAVMADVDNPLIPNAFIGARNGVQDFAKYVNASCSTKDKCLAGRKLVVDFYDSHVNANDTRNGQIQACANDLAMVGTAALLVSRVDDMRNCKDQAGATTGIPEIPVIASALVQWCSDESFPMVPPPIRCDTEDQHPQTWITNVARGYYFTKKYGDVHGIYIFSNDTPFGHAAQFEGIGGVRELSGGVKGVLSDQDFAISAASLQQSEFTTMVQAMKAHNSNYASCAVEYECTVLLRKEAALQGATDQVKVWDCDACYDKKFLHAGTDVEDEYVDLQSLPFYDPKEAKANPMLANFVRYTGKDNVDSSAVQAWSAAVAFRDAVNAVVKTHGVNGLTRANLLAALNGIHKFDADGMLAPIDLAGRKQSDCHVLTQVRNGTFVRVEPTKPGTFDCNPKYVVTRKLNLLASP